MDRSFDRDGLTCMTCHSIQSVGTKLGNGSFVMAVPAVMVDEQGNRIPDLVPDSEILAHLDRHSKAVMQDIYHKAEFCSACHKANLPPMLNGYKWIRAFNFFRRVAEFEVFATESAHLLHCGFHHLSVVPHDAGTGQVA